MWARSDATDRLRRLAVHPLRYGTTTTPAALNDANTRMPG